MFTRNTYLTASWTKAIVLIIVISSATFAAGHDDVDEDEILTGDTTIHLEPNLSENTDNTQKEEIINIETNSGSVRGKRFRTDDGHYSVFYGIPFAKPPLGQLRFKPPEKIDPWGDQVVDATSPRPYCYQQNQIKGIGNELRLTLLRPWSENCLHLNIWAPAPWDVKKPVVVFIHGGGFIIGSGMWLTDGTSLALEGLVVVTINYRLNAFGFLSLGVPDAPGNVGLMDQNLALQWVKENVEHFYGDPNSITIMGMSAGGASVGYHLLAPKSRGLFTRAIMMSGSPTNIWAIAEPEDSIEMSNKLLASLGCKSQNLVESLACLRQRDPEDIIESLSTTDGLLNKPFVPTVDGDFIVEHPFISIASGRFNPADVIVGSAEDEGASFMVLESPSYFKSKDGRLSRREFEELLSSLPGVSRLGFAALDVTYTDWSKPNDPIMLRDAMKAAKSDLLFDCRVNEFADKLSEAGHTVYRYVYGYKSDVMAALRPNWAGACHGEDQLAVLGPTAMLQLAPSYSEDQKVNQRLRKQIYNFVKNGNPNLEKNEYPDEPEWPKYDQQKKHLYISSKSTVQTKKRLQQCAVWLQLLPLLKKNC